MGGLLFPVIVQGSTSLLSYYGMFPLISFESCPINPILYDSIGHGPPKLPQHLLISKVRCQWMILVLVNFFRNKYFSTRQIDTFLTDQIP